MSARHSSQNTLENIAADLLALAHDFAQGKLRVGNRLVAIGNPLFIKTKQKISGDTAYCTLSFQVPLLDSDREAVVTGGKAHTPPKSGADSDNKELRLKGRPPEGKKIKKELSRLWKTATQKMEQGQAPSPAEEKALLSALENYTVFSEPGWHEEWLNCLAQLREGLACARRGEMRKAMEYAEEVNRLTKLCHKQYK